MEQQRPAEVRGRLAVATVVTSNVNRAAREHAVPDRYDVVLDVFPEDGGGPRRVHLADVTLGPMLPMIGSTVTVRVFEDERGGDGRGGDDHRDDHGGGVEIVWRGDPNLDVEAHRRQIAALAESARRRKRSWVEAE